MTHPPIHIKPTREILDRLRDLIHKHFKRYCRDALVLIKEGKWQGATTSAGLKEEFKSVIADKQRLTRDYRDVAILMWVLGQLDADAPENLSSALGRVTVAARDSNKPPTSAELNDLISSSKAVATRNEELNARLTQIDAWLNDACKALECDLNNAASAAQKLLQEKEDLSKELGETQIALQEVGRELKAASEILQCEVLGVAAAAQALVNTAAKYAREATSTTITLSQVESAKVLDALQSLKGEGIAPTGGESSDVRDHLCEGSVVERGSTPGGKDKRALPKARSSRKIVPHRRNHKAGTGEEAVGTQPDSAKE